MMISALGFLVVTAALAGQASPAGGDRPPNVVIIYADDLGWGDLGCYGNVRYPTPRIDRMAEEGARLTNFTSTYPYCAPSRASLQTGRYSFRTGIIGNPEPETKNDGIGIPASEVTLGEAFGQAGYATACFGKWHLGHHPEFLPKQHGYGEYFGIPYSNDMHPVALFEGNERVEYPVEQSTLTKRYAERSLRFIERNKDHPFFLYVPGVMPHKPLAASEAFYGKSGGGLYGDAVAELDWSVGQILDKIRELSLDEQTLVVFSSDNGPWYGGSTGGLRGMKGTNWEGGLRVPLIARWPGRIPTGHVSDQPAVIIDLFITCLKVAGIPIPADRPIDGLDIWPLLTTTAKSPHEAIFSLNMDQLRTVRSGPWKLHLKQPSGPRDVKDWKPDEEWIDPRAPDGVRILAPREQAHPSQYPGVRTGDPFQGIALFNLDDDPAEQHDLAARHPDVVARLRTLYDAMQAQMPKSPDALR